MRLSAWSIPKPCFMENVGFCPLLIIGRPHRDDRYENTIVRLEAARTLISCRIKDEVSTSAWRKAEMWTHRACRRRKVQTRIICSRIEKRLSLERQRILVLARHICHRQYRCKVPYQRVEPGMWQPVAECKHCQRLQQIGPGVGPRG